MILTLGSGHVRLCIKCTVACAGTIAGPASRTTATPTSIGRQAPLPRMGRPPPTTEGRFSQWASCQGYMLFTSSWKKVWTTNIGDCPHNPAVAMGVIKSSDIIHANNLIMFSSNFFFLFKFLVLLYVALCKYIIVLMHTTINENHSLEYSGIFVSR